MERSKQEYRERILAQITEVISEALHELDSHRAVRILGDTPNSILDAEDYLASIHPFVSTVQQCLQQNNADNKSRFLAASIYPGKHSYFIVDLNNANYNYETAHECKTPIPVYVLRLSKRAPTIRRAPTLDVHLAVVLAKMHNSHGRDPLPLFEDHNDPNLAFSNPRSLRR
ncbi:uncharacterized protein DSM5745_11242 [Aspergillus mulundensis]|uniref:Uncharacterized protein n=1 Tax=Aspergillus mulundensis TaxID=1810919 RepID=A0A3D8Q9U8_9EURO|nr:Uncharacterized protein DSM5745_11242 [Aspergillus mulundensis]RDW58551.1 Uncharacterized protein DSM5745_11242 [Aspergillus mulundensis]